MSGKVVADPNDLKTIPGIGKNIERHLQNIGINTVKELRGKNPEDLYLQDCLFKGFTEDKCILYVFRLAVYFAENDNHDPKKLKWFYWKDKEYPEKTLFKITAEVAIITKLANLFDVSIDCLVGRTYKSRTFNNKYAIPIFVLQIFKGPLKAVLLFV